MNNDKCFCSPSTRDLDASRASLRRRRARARLRDLAHVLELELLYVLRQQRLGQALALDLLQQVLEAEVLQVLEVEVLEVLEVDLSLCLLAQP